MNSFKFLLWISIFSYFIYSTVQTKEYANKSIAPFDAIISLGGNCQIAFQLNINGLRHYSLPFDYWITPFMSLYNLLENKFVHFLDKENFIFSPPNETSSSWVVDSLYGVIMIHDFKLDVDFLKDYEMVRAKFERRIDRFYTVLSKSNYVLFIRNWITKDEAIALDELLGRLFPHLSYRLVVLSSSEESFSTDWGFDRIKNFYLRQPVPYVALGDNQAWKEIFINCGLTIDARK